MTILTKKDNGKKGRAVLWIQFVPFPQIHTLKFLPLGGN
jgi:hypothetical protein